VNVCEEENWIHICQVVSFFQSLPGNVPVIVLQIFVVAPL